MSFLPRISSRAWIGILICASGFLVWLDTIRARHVEFVTGLVTAEVSIDVVSPTGYAGGLRRLIVPEHNNDSYQWIAQTQQMLAQKMWHVRHVSYDNAPLGRDVRSPSPYRWWLGSIAWLDHLVSGRPLGVSVEQAAIEADPLLHLLVLMSAVVFTAWRFGTFSAALLVIAVATIFPFAGFFLPGQPNDGGLQQACALWSLLLFLAGIGPAKKIAPRPGLIACSGARNQGWFFAAGIFGGLGLWVGLPKGFSILAGIAAGGLLSSFLSRRAGHAKNESDGGAIEPAAWRIWSLGGAVSCLIVCLVENFSFATANLRAGEINPLHGLAWLGAGELLTRTTAFIQRRNFVWNRRVFVVTTLALLAAAALPAVMLLKSDESGFAVDALASRLTNLTGSPVAQNTWEWVRRGGLTLAIAATFLPALLLAPAIWLLVRRGTNAMHRHALAVALGPVTVAMAFSFSQLRWWNVFDTALLALLVAVATTVARDFKSFSGRRLLAGGVVLTLAPGAILLLAPIAPGARETVTSGDVEALIERDISQWLANQAGAGGAVVLAPPNLTTSLYFHGGLGGLGTPYWENKDGFQVAIRIAGATSADEAQAVARGRNLKYIVVPSWDNFLDEYAQLGSKQTDHSLITLLHRWLPPRWLRPIPYNLPKVAGFEGQSVAIFGVVDLQDNASALSRLAEYFAEMGQTDQAAAASQALQRLFPGDLSAAVARAQVDKAVGDQSAFDTASAEIVSLVSRNEDRELPWDRRVSLAIALAEAKHFDLARTQTQRCLAELDEARLRSLNTVPLYRLQAMTRAFGLRIGDETLRELAARLLPSELRKDL